MRRLIVALLVCLVVAPPLAVAQHPPAAKPPAAAAAGARSPQVAKGVTSVPDRATLEKVMNAWASLDTDNVLPYYDQKSRLPFYDVAPLEYKGFPAYLAGVTAMIPTVASLKVTVNDDAAVHPAGTNCAFSTTTLRMRMEDKAGHVSEMDGRWTAIWQRKAGIWVIVHEHVSAPLAGPPEK